LNYSKPVPRGQFPTHNLVKIWNTGHINSSLVGQDDADTVVFTVAPSRAGALIGAGPTGPPIQPLLGSSDFKAYNLDIENRASVSYGFSPGLIYQLDLHAFRRIFIRLLKPSPPTFRMRMLLSTGAI
jgi:hypothetical protein